MKAKYIGSVKNIDPNYLHMEFEYRGRRYFVTRALSWTACSSDYTMNGSMAEWKQHKRAQELIDSTIEAEKNPQPIAEAKWTKEYEDEIWSMLGFD